MGRCGEIIDVGVYWFGKLGTVSDFTFFHDFRFRRLFYLRSERGGKGAEVVVKERL